jgi:hypothetical protein
VRHVRHWRKGCGGDDEGEDKEERRRERARERFDVLF